MTHPQPLSEAPRAVAWLEPYWEGLAQGELKLPTCSVCGRWEWYPVASAPACPGSRYIWRPIGDGATVFAFTRVFRPLLPDVTDPYVTGLVTPDDAPAVRIPALLLERGTPVSIGARVRLAFAGEGAAAFPYFETEEMT